MSLCCLCGVNYPSSLMDKVTVFKTDTTLDVCVECGRRVRSEQRLRKISELLEE